MDIRDLGTRADVHPSPAETDAEFLRRLNRELDLGLDEEELQRTIDAVSKQQFSTESLTSVEEEAIETLRERLQTAIPTDQTASDEGVATRSGGTDECSEGDRAESGEATEHSPDGQMSSESTESTKRTVLSKQEDGADGSDSLWTSLTLSAGQSIVVVVIAGLVLTALVTGAVSQGLLSDESEGQNEENDGFLVTPSGGADSNDTGQSSQNPPPRTVESQNGSGQSGSDGSEGSGSAKSPSTADAVDSDSDGLSDRLENRNGLDPQYPDSDGDGLNDSIEFHGPTDPLDPDTDGDGLRDGWEVEHGLNATNNDTDGDGLEDQVEIENSLDPLSVDTDGDGLDDLTEFNGETNATVPDTDGDGLADGRELELGAEPTNPDTDDDGLEDGPEIEHGTNLTNADTDGDRLLDGWEVEGEAPSGAQLPDADPLHKDLYVQVSKSSESLRYTSRDKAVVRGAFSSMSVANPDGDDGIDVHFSSYPFQNPVREEVDSEGEARDILTEYSPNDYVGSVQGVGDRAGVYHHVMLVRFSDDANVSAVAEAPGYNVVVDEGNTSTHGGTISYRNRLVIRGLLQNIVGDPPESVSDPDQPRFTRFGWMKYGIDGLITNEYLPNEIEQVIERDGFSS